MNQLDSLASRLLLPMLTGIALVLVLGAVFLDKHIKDRLVNDFDATVEARARTLVTLTFQNKQHIEINFADEFMPEFESPIRPEYFQIWTGERQLVERSRSLGTTDLATTWPSVGDSVMHHTILPDGRNGREFEIGFIPHIEDDVQEELGNNAPSMNKTAVLVLAKGTEELDASVRAIRVTGAIVFFLAILIASIVTLLANRWGLLPLSRLASDIKALDPVRLDQRLTLNPAVKELQPVVEQVNELLGKLENSRIRERHFVSDVAHELRTPVAEIKTLSQVANLTTLTDGERNDFFNDTERISTRMGHMIDSLLALSKYDADVQVSRRTWSSLNELITRAIDTQRQIIKDKDLQIHFFANHYLFDIYTDPDKVAILINNVISNSCRYALPQTQVSITLDETTKEQLAVTIANQTDSLEQKDLSLMFSRFWRKDDGRIQDGHGLGLSLVAMIAELLQIGIKTKLQSKGQASPLFSIELTGIQSRRSISD